MNKITQEPAFVERRGMGIPEPHRGNRIAVPEIAQRLNIGRLAVYAMLEKKLIPAIRLGRRWIITRSAYLEWERTCGGAQPEVMV
jgi:excisionase family DNA binding protein